MGTDIHAYVEQPEGHWVHSVAKVKLPRDYHMFGLLAGIRGGTAVIEPRGIPEKIGYTAYYDYYAFLVPEGELTVSALSSSDARHAHVRNAQTDLWLSAGYSKLDPLDPDYISSPGWHTPSRLSAHEFSSVLDVYRSEYDAEPRLEYVALCDYMAALGGTRLLFWFDN